MPGFPMSRRKTRARRKRKTRKRTGPMIRSLDPIPQTKLVKHRYSQFVTIDPALGVVNSVWNLSHMFDPNATDTLGDHQPYFYDTLFSQYREYIVIGAKFTATLVNNDNTYPIAVVSQIRDSSTLETFDINNMIEQGKSTYMILSDQSAQPPKAIRNHYSCKKFWGVKDVQDDDDLKAKGSTKPDKEAFCHLSVQALNTSVDPAPLSVHVLIEYLALWRNPKLVPQS